MQVLHFSLRLCHIFVSYGSKIVSAISFGHCTAIYTLYCWHRNLIGYRAIFSEQIILYRIYYIWQVIKMNSITSCSTFFIATTLYFLLCLFMYVQHIVNSYHRIFTINKPSSLTQLKLNSVHHIPWLINRVYLAFGTRMGVWGLNFIALLTFYA